MIIATNIKNNKMILAKALGNVSGLKPSNMAEEAEASQGLDLLYTTMACVFIYLCTGLNLYIPDCVSLTSLTCLTALQVDFSYSTRQMRLCVLNPSETDCYQAFTAL